MILRELPGGRSGCGSRSLRLESLESRQLLHASHADGHDHAPAYVPGELIVGFEADVAQLYVQAREHDALELARDKVAGHGLSNPVALAHQPQQNGRAARLSTLWHIDTGEDLLTAAEQIATLPGVAYAEPNYIVTALTNHPAEFPDDSRFSQLWGMHNDADTDIDAPEAWGISTGSGNTVVAVIDTGINYNHPDLAANIWTNPLEIADNGFDDDGNGYVDDVHGYDFVNDDPDPLDDAGHGTHVSGTIGAVGNNGTGVVGVNWNVGLMGLKFLDANGSGTTADAIEALEYLNATITALGDHGIGLNVAATNNSWGGGGFSQGLQDAIAASGVTPYSDGVLFVAAAGNNGSSSADYPAAYELPNIISVAATDDTDSLASFSNFGTNVDLAAPGVNILSTKGNSYGKLSGTSMATPHVAGAAALVWDQYGSTANVADVKSDILDSVDPLASLSGLVETGGRLNVAGALKQVGMEVVSSTPLAGTVVSSTSSPESFSVSFSHPVADGVDPIASDFSVTGPGGVPETADTATVSADRMSITYDFNASPLSPEGPHTMSLASGAVTTSAPLWDVSSQAWTSGTFYYDTSPLTVQSFATDAAEDGVDVVDLNGAPVTVSVQFSELIDPSSVGTDDLEMSQGVVTGASVVLPDVVEYTVEGLAHQGVWTINMPWGAVLDQDANPVAAASGTRILDITSAAFPTPLVAAPPAASRIYEGATTGVLDHPSGDTDQFTLYVDGGQTVTIVVRPDNDLSPSITIPELVGASAQGGELGEPVYLQTAMVPADMTLTIVLANASGSGAYQLEVLLGSAAGEVGNGDLANAQTIDSSFVNLASGSARRGGVRSAASRVIPPARRRTNRETTFSPSKTICEAAGRSPATRREECLSGRSTMAQV